MSVYYSLKPASGTVETGPIFPQIQKMKASYDFDSQDSVYALSKHTTEFAKFNPNLDYFILHNQAKLTDCLSCVFTSSIGLLVSEKLKTCLEKFKLVSHRFYEANVSYKGKIHHYFFMHVISDLSDFVNYEKSIFFILHNFSHNLGYISIKSSNDFDAKRIKVKNENPQQTVAIWSEKLTMIKNFDNTLDFFEIGKLDYSYYISEQLYQKLMTERISGMQIDRSLKIILEI
jgi:hypothetical protein